MMTLEEGNNGKIYIIEESTVKQPAKQRLEAMGLIEGTFVRKINEALDGSIILMVRGTRVGIGRELAELIVVREVTESNIRHKRRRRGLGRRNCSGKGCGHNE